MISYPIYKVVHYLGIFVTLTAVATFLARSPSPDAPAESRNARQRRTVALHGVGLFLILLGGFGMLARLEITEGLGLPGWIWAKLGIWGVIGVTVTIARRRPATTGWLLAVLPLLALAAGVVAIFKPF